MSFLDLLNASISASWLVLAVIVLRFLLKKAPKAIHCCLWALVAVRLLCPLSIESQFSLVPSTETVSRDYIMEPAVHSAEQTVLDIVENPIYPEHVDVVLDTAVSRVSVWEINWSWIWLVGVGVMGLYVLVSWLRLRKKVSACIPIARDIRLCDYIESPFILGIVRPKIYLPSDMDQETIDHVLAHERAHLKRHDHWWKPLGFLLLTVHWFNPVMWLAYILLCRDIELACDEKVIRDLDAAQKRSYSCALLQCSVSRPMIAACPLAFGEVGVKERVKNVLNYKKPTFWIIVLSVILCCVVAVCFLTDPVSPEAPADDHVQLTEGTYVSQEKVHWSWFSSLYVEGMTMEIQDDAVTLDLQGVSLDGYETTLPLDHDWQTACPINETRRKALAELSDIEPAFAIQDLSDCRYLVLDTTHFIAEKEGELYLVAWYPSNIHLEIIQYIFHMVPEEEFVENGTTIPLGTATLETDPWSEAVRTEIVNYNVVYTMEPHLTCASYVPIATAHGKGPDGSFQEILAAVRVATYYQREDGILEENHAQLFKALFRVQEDAGNWTVTEYWQSNTQELTDLDWDTTLPVTDLSEPTEYALELEYNCLQQARAYFGMEGISTELGYAAEETIRQYFLEQKADTGENSFTSVSFQRYGVIYSGEDRSIFAIQAAVRTGSFIRDADDTIIEASSELLPVRLSMKRHEDGTYEVTNCTLEDRNYSGAAFTLEAECWRQAFVHFDPDTDDAVAALRTKYPEYFTRDTTHGLDLLWWDTDEGVRCVILSGLQRTRVGSEAGNHPPLTVAEAMMVLQAYDIPVQAMVGQSSSTLAFFHVDAP